MDLGLKGKTALVLGASRGLGRGIALALAKEGVRVAIVARSAERLATMVDEADSLPGELIPISADLSEEKAPQRIAHAAFEALDHVDIFVANGGGPPPGPISQVEGDQWRQHFNNMIAPLMELSRLLLPSMRERRWGRILVLTSSGVRQPIPNLGISNALRASLVGWAKTLSAEVAADGVTVNILLPGRIATERVAELDNKAAERQSLSVEEISRQSRQAIPVGRYGRVEEFAAGALFLASEPASYVTGVLLPIDGGLIKAI